MKVIHPATYLGVIVSALLLINTCLGIYGASIIAQRRHTLSDLCQLKSDILHANLALNRATIAPNEYLREQELSKMLVTRESANGIYARIAASDLNNLERIIYLEMKAERKEYREAQLKVVELVRKDTNDIDMWHNAGYYSTLVERYLGRVNAMSESLKQRSLTEIKHAQAVMFTMLSLSIILVVYVIMRVFK